MLILARKIEVDVVQLENLSANILINKDGSFEVEKYFPQSSETEEAEPINSTLNKTNFQVPYCGNSLVAPSKAGDKASTSVVSSGAVCAYSLILNVESNIFLSFS